MADTVPSPLGRRLVEACGIEPGMRVLDVGPATGDERLPFEDGTFDVVISSMGVTSAPDTQRVADELVRVCRPGGTIGLLSRTRRRLIRRHPHGSATQLHRLFGARVAFDKRNAGVDYVLSVGTRL